MSTDVARDLGYSKSEIMIAASARQLAGVNNCFVGVGLPNIVCNLSQRTVTPDLQLVYGSGVYGARPERLPLSIGDPTLATGSTAITSMFELFAFYLQAGLIDVAFLGGAQIDRHGNLNTTVIGDYTNPKVRLPGSGGACEIAIHAKQIFVIMRQAQRSFVDAWTSEPRPDTAAIRARRSARMARERADRRRHRPRHLLVRRRYGGDRLGHPASRRDAGRRPGQHGVGTRVADKLGETPPPHRRSSA